MPTTSPNSRWARKNAVGGTNAISGLTGGSGPTRDDIHHRPADPPAVTIPPLVRSPGTFAHAAAAVTAANAKCTIVSANTRILPCSGDHTRSVKTR